MWTDYSPFALRADGARKDTGLEGISPSAERGKALKNLGRVLRFVEIHGEEDVVRGKAERLHLTRAEEVRDILHLYKWHRGRLILHAG